MKSRVPSLSKGINRNGSPGERQNKQKERRFKYTLFLPSFERRRTRSPLTLYGCGRQRATAAPSRFGSTRDDEMHVETMGPLFSDRRGDLHAYRLSRAALTLFFCCCCRFCQGPRAVCVLVCVRAVSLAGCPSNEWPDKTRHRTDSASGINLSTHPGPRSRAFRGALCLLPQSPPVMLFVLFL